jgi:Phosphoribosyl transferase domain
VPTDVDVTDPKISIFVPVAPASTEGVCAVCHNATTLREYGGGYWPTCWNCRIIAAGGVRTIVPISLVHKVESQLYASLRDYKSESQYITDRVRRDHRLLLAAALQRFLRVHRSHIEEAASAEWDAIQVVPSTRTDRAEHPLERVVGMAPGLRDDLVHFLTATGEPISRTGPNPAAFSASADVTGRRVLIVDDTFTTGSHVQSAAVALSNAGATVVAAIPIGRVIDTNRPEKEEFWRGQRAIAFDFDTCALE